MYINFFREKATFFDGSDVHFILFRQPMSVPRIIDVSFLIRPVSSTAIYIFVPDFSPVLIQSSDVDCMTVRDGVCIISANRPIFSRSLLDAR